MSTLTIEEQAAPSTPGANKVVVYGKADGNIYSKDDTGVESRLSYLFSPIKNSLSGDVALSTAAAYFDGPSIAQGTSGTWFVSGAVTFLDTAAAASFDCKLWDGTTVIAAGSITSGGASFRAPIALSGFIVSPAGNLRMSARGVSLTTGVIKFNVTGTSTDSIITGIRIA